jgi:tetratricopeptide (TPR) repeat protein
MFELKPLTADAIPRALEKAERYRLLNEPAEAESICEDILRLDPDNQEALVALLLALTEQFDDGIGGHLGAARGVLGRLNGDYERHYYAGLIAERQGKAQLRVGGPGAGAMGHECIHQAMRHYEQAERLRPPGNDDALLRWNACARLLMRDHADVVVAEERFEPFLE